VNSKRRAERRKFRSTYCARSRQRRHLDVAVHAELEERALRLPDGVVAVPGSHRDTHDAPNDVVGHFLGLSVQRRDIDDGSSETGTTARHDRNLDLRVQPFALKRLDGFRAIVAGVSQLLGNRVQVPHVLRDTERRSLLHAKGAHDGSAVGNTIEPAHPE
jgi:hypothetical protein